MFNWFDIGLTFMPSEIILVYLLLFGTHSVILWTLFATRLPPVGKRLLILLYVLHIVLIVLHALTRSWSADWAWYFNFKFGEFNPSASFSAMQYILVVLSAFLIALWAAPGRWWHRAYWLLIGLIFLYLGLDEYLVIHERIPNWHVPYLTVGVLMVLLTAAFYLLGLKRRYLWTFVLLFGGLGLAALGGYVVEFLGAANCLGWTGPCNELPFIEESLENIGVLTALVGVLIYAWAQIPADSWSRVRRVILSGGAASLVLFLAGPWVVPPLEARFIATPVAVGYGEVGIQIVGYYAPQTQLRPGDTLNVRLFWRRTPSVGQDYGMSLHLLRQPDGQSYAQVDKYILNPSFADANQLMTYPRDMSLTLSKDAPAPGRYWLGVAVWNNDAGSSGDFAEQVIASTDRFQVSETMAVLGSITVLDPAADLSTTQTVRYDFANGMTLTGYSLDLDDDTLTLQFAWEARSALSRRYTQFLHVVDAEGHVAFGHDQPPFNGAFPTDTWSAGLRVRDTWQLALPEDLPPGEYRVLTGLYDSESQQREIVYDGNGNLLQDDSIDLGWIER